VHGLAVIGGMDMANKLIDRDEDIQQAAQAIKGDRTSAAPEDSVCAGRSGDSAFRTSWIKSALPRAIFPSIWRSLRDKGVLATRKDANRVYYRIGDLRTLKLVGMMRDVFCVA